MKLARQVTGFAVLLAAIIAAIWLAQDRPAASSRESETAAPARERSIHPVPTRDPGDDPAGAQAAEREKIQNDWDALILWLRAVPPPSAEEIEARLLATRIAWTTTDPQARAEALRKLLETGEDAVTGLDFAVGNHGLLAGWPTLRVFLLDILATSDPEMASATARQLLDRTDSPDEYATALRSLTRQGIARANDSELVSRFGHMLDRPQWDQSRGFAEALDLARVVGSAEAARKLAAWNGNPVLKAMAMDEFAAEHPQAMMEVLDGESSVTGKSRARLMARADPADAGQLAAVDNYLRSPDRTDEEAAVFLKLFPLRSATTGFRLYGTPPSPYTFEQIKAGDQVALDRVDAWAGDPALGKYRPHLAALQQRLAEWVGQAEE